MRERLHIADDITVAEASAWLTRLQGPARTAAMEDAFRLWLAESTANARAFARVADTWEIIAGAACWEAADIDASVASRHRQRRALLAAVIASVAVMLVVAGFVGFQLRAPVYQTSIGEIESVTLSDGTRVTLNADTRLRVFYRKHERRVRLEHGEAEFDDIENPQRPFLVQADGYQVRALGTIFDMYSAPKHLDVTLINGRVDVSRATSANGKPASARTVLSPGERLVIRGNGQTRIDHPSLEAISAWQRGQAVFNDVPLADAIAQINRYGGTPIRIADPALEQVRVSGVFPIRDPGEFADAISSLRHLHVVRSNKSVVITR
ncbi:MAG: FecR family protein [Rhodanobacteraceae bacterium]